MIRIKFRWFSILLLILLPSLKGEGQETNEQLTVLKKGIIGREFIFGSWVKEESEIHLKYLGQVKTSKGDEYRILTSVWLWGLSKRATNRILIFDGCNRYLGYYMLTMRNDLPVQMENGVLSFADTKECSQRSTVKIDLKPGLPKEFYLKCTSNSGDMYSYNQESSYQQFPLASFFQSITISHIGVVSDKPIFTLIISNTMPLKRSIDERHIKVDNKTLELLLRFAVSNKKDAMKMEPIEYPFGSFVIETQNKNDKKDYVLNNTQVSIKYFRKLSAFLEKNSKKSLALEINRLIIRIE